MYEFGANGLADEEQEERNERALRALLPNDPDWQAVVEQAAREHEEELRNAERSQPIDQAES